MAHWRRIALVLLLAIVGVPLAMPFLEASGTFRRAASFHPDRLFLLARNTLVVIAGTVAVALPLGTVAAVLLYRTDLPGRRVLRFLTVMILFVPLPVLTTAWQAALGQAGLWTLTGRPWSEGLSPAIWIHVQAALPWVILIVGQGLLHVEPELEEDALLAAGPWRVLLSVTLPRCRGTIVAAGAWVALQVSGEIAVVDMMLVDTFAREVYNEFSLGGGDAMARAVMLSMPWMIVVTGGICWGLMRQGRVLPPLGAALTETRLLLLGGGRWVWFGVAMAMLTVTAGIPVASLIWKSGQVSVAQERSGPTARDMETNIQWSGPAMVERVAKMMKGDAGLIWKSLLTMLLSAAIITSVGLLLCWLAEGAPWFRGVLFVLMALAWSMPGPIIGLGLKETIMALVDWVDFEPLLVALHYGPSSPLPVLWAHLLRFLPCAVVVMWPAMRLLPRELRDSLAVEGASPMQQLRYLVWPWLRRTWLAMAVVIVALALGEIGAVAMSVETPAWKMFAHELFDRMHYGQPHDVTALCLVLLLIVAASGVAAWVIGVLTRSWR